ncbi:MAG: adenine deaminase C-terminal domain-containing protein [Desulfurococcales archaeon]|jgi:adenine deaminase|nr:adenine deaminase C-terminal domain-containing protein [Desulfurococcales archaeon]
MEDLIKIVNSIRQREKADLIIENANIVDVVTGSIDEGFLLIKDKYIMLLGSGKANINASNTIDAKGRYIIPGFIDSHTHIESSMMIPTLYSLYQLKEGTTAAVIDPHEIVNIAGIDGLKAFIDDTENAPLRFLVQVPPCIPASEERFETSGASMLFNNLKEVMEDLDDKVAGLAEVMCYGKILEGDEDIFRKISLIYERGFVIDGHAAGLRGEELQAFIASRIMTDHTIRKADELLERLKLGLYIQIQIRPQETDFDEIVKHLKSIDTSRVMWCTDDAEADEIARGRYSIRAIVKSAIENGLDPVKAIKMATINVAQAYRIDTKIGIISPGRYADIIIVNSLDKLDIHTVIFNGKIAIHNGKILLEAISPSPSLLKFKGNTIKIKKTVNAEALLPTAPIERGLITARALNVNGIIEIVKVEVDNHVILSNPDKDIAWINIIERHGKTGNISKGLITKTGIKTGAFVSSISHDSHNILIISVDVKSSLACLEEITKTGGGLCLADNGNIMSQVPLPFYGLMTSDPDIAEELERFKEKLTELGFRAPLKRLLTLTLPVRKSGFAITDKGLVDYKGKEILPIIINK